jgi:hypothetical protein
MVPCTVWWPTPFYFFGIIDMKTKFHLAKRTPSRYAAPSSGPGAAQSVALIDERYLGWLAGQQNPQPAGSLQRGSLLPVFSGLARHSGAEGALTRAYLFTDRQPTELLDDVVCRMVPSHASDGGLGLVRALGLELTQLAARGGCQCVLVASDDERLIPYIDEAQWRGLRVVLVTDESAQDFPRLMGEDPSWARLLMQADRRVSLPESAWLALTTPGATYAGSATPYESERPSEGYAPSESYPDSLPNDEWRAHVQKVIEDWWRDETPHAKLDLYEEMQNSQGVPPETDRHLLLQVRRVLARTLSFPEKKAMREMIRATVLLHPPVVDESIDA